MFHFIIFLAVRVRVHSSYYSIHSAKYTSRWYRPWSSFLINDGTCLLCLPLPQPSLNNAYYLFCTTVDRCGHARIIGSAARIEGRPVYAKDRQVCLDERSEGENGGEQVVLHEREDGGGSQGAMERIVRGFTKFILLLYDTSIIISILLVLILIGVVDEGQRGAANRRRFR